jgi:hypothetical protein
LLSASDKMLIVSERVFGEILHQNKFVLEIYRSSL